MALSKTTKLAGIIVTPETFTLQVRRAIIIKEGGPKTGKIVSESQDRESIVCADRDEMMAKLEELL